MKSYSVLKKICFASALVLFSASAAADYPTKPIRLVAAYSPGGTSDLIARLAAQYMSPLLGQQVVVENKAGANGNIGTGQVARSDPDGYTLLLGTAGNMTVNPALYKDMTFNPINDFQPVSLIATLPNIMVVNKNVPAKTVTEFVDWAKSQPEKIFFASSGVGSTIHLTGELFNLTTGLQMEHVPYKGAGPALTDIIGGTGPVVMFDNMPTGIGQVRGGTLNGLAVTSPTRAESAPEIPTIKESGYPDFEVVTWFGIFAPAGTPPDIVKKLNETLKKVVNSEPFKERLKELGASAKYTTPEEFEDIVKADTEKWAHVVKSANVVMP